MWVSLLVTLVVAVLAGAVYCLVAFVPWPEGTAKAIFFIFMFVYVWAAAYFIWGRDYTRRKRDDSSE